MKEVDFLFDFHPIVIFLCMVAGITYAYLLYSSKQLWGRTANIILFTLRALLVTLIAVLLVGTAVRSTITKKEKPTFVLLIDNSISVREALSADTWSAVYNRLMRVMQHIKKKGFDVAIQTLNGKLNDTVRFIHPSSDLYGAEKRILEEYEGKNLAGLVVVSDGIYNSGISPLYSPFKIPVYTVGVGDTIQHADVRIKSITCNKAALQGNQFPLSVEVLAQEIHNQHVEVYIREQGKLVAKATKQIGLHSLITFDFELEAKKTGLRHIEVEVKPLSQEKNLKNNNADVYINVVESQKNVLLLSPSPHPDNKAIRSAITNETNYALTLYIPDVQTPPLVWTGKKKPDVVIFRYTAHGEAIDQLLDSINKYDIPLFIMLGEGGDVKRWNEIGLDVHLVRGVHTMGARPIVDLQYDRFRLPGNLNDIVTQYPPANTFFRITSYPPNADVLLWEQDQGKRPRQPLLFSFFNNHRAIAVLRAENIWKWRMSEFAQFETTQAFDLIFSKLVRYLGAWRNKENFRSFPIKNEFTVAEPVVFESQVYNHLLERVYGYPIDLKLTNEQGKVRSYHYVSRPNQSRYIIGDLEKGTYTYHASTILDGKKKMKTGEFRVITWDIELQDLTADFMLLRAWAQHTEGFFYKTTNLNQLANDLEDREVGTHLYHEKHLTSLIDVKWLFLLLLLLVGAEWYVRKWLGGY